VLDALTALDAVDAACTLLQRGQILAIQGLGGYQLACDATQADVVARLRERKRRDRKPFALMARDVTSIGRHAVLTDVEAALLASPPAPIVILRRASASASAHTASSTSPVADGVAPGLDSLGFMLPNTPLHHLLLRRMGRPIVLTSGNVSDEPQAIEADDAHGRLASIADYFLEHDRPIARRVDDSVARIVAATPRLLRRARGYAPAALALPAGFEDAPPVLAYGSELKNTFCLVREGSAVLSPHLGDLQEPLSRADARRTLADFYRFFDFAPRALACDLHPDYTSTQHARTDAAANGLPLIVSQHHHAHIAACLVDNGIARGAPPVIGVALDGVGYGADGTLWGGEFLLADYTDFQRLGTFAGGVVGRRSGDSRALAQYLRPHHGPDGLARLCYELCRSRTVPVSREPAPNAARGDAETRCQRAAGELLRTAVRRSRRGHGIRAGAGRIRGPGRDGNGSGRRSCCAGGRR